MPKQNDASDPAAPSALLLACLLNHTLLARSLLDLPVAWDFRETTPALDPKARSDRLPGQDGEEGWPAASLLLRRARNSWNSSHFERHRGSPLSEGSEIALEMVRRGASPAYPSETPGASPLASAIAYHRVDFLEGLVGHPEFAFQTIHPLLCQNGSELLSSAIARGQIDSARLLVEKAGWPINRLDKDGLYPLGYSRTAEMAQALLDLGADPALKDAAGLNALARIQDIDNTSEREQIISKFTAAFRKSASKDPALLEALRSENVAALFEAAENAPKSTLSKIIGSFKFDVAKLRDPKTGRTPLMAALLGGRKASAAELLSRGCDINAVDQEGISAAAYMLLGNDANSRSGTSLNLGAREVDWSLTCSKGYPVALQPALLASHCQNLMELPALALNSAASNGADLRSLRLPDGSPFAAAYLSVAPEGGGWIGQRYSTSLFHLSEKAGQADGAFLSLRSLLESSYSGFYGQNLEALAVAWAKIPIDDASRPFLSQAISEISPEGRERFLKIAPKAFAAAEALSVASSLSDPAAAPRRPKGL